jgi:large subunit ribosomal protein L19
MSMALLTEVKPNPNIPDFTSGDTVRVSVKVVEGDKERTQVFQGVVIRVRHRGPSSNFTVRRVTYGVGVERTFPVNSPRLEKVEVLRRGKKRRAKLYYLRGLSARTSRLKERRLSAQELAQEQEALRLKQQEELAQEEAPEVAQEQKPELEKKEAPELEHEPEPVQEEKKE